MQSVCLKPQEVADAKQGQPEVSAKTICACYVSLLAAHLRFASATLVVAANVKFGSSSFLEYMDTAHGCQVVATWKDPPPLTLLAYQGNNSSLQSTCTFRKSWHDFVCSGLVGDCHPRIHEQGNCNVSTAQFQHSDGMETMIMCILALECTSNLQQPKHYHLLRCDVGRSGCKTFGASSPKATMHLMKAMRKSLPRSYRCISAWSSGWAFGNVRKASDQQLNL